jgi:gas vesicle protein
MKHFKLFSLVLPVAAAFLLAGCGQRGSEGVATGPEGAVLRVKVPDKLVVTQGEEKEFSVAVQRDKIDGPVNIEFVNLPAGVDIAQKDRTIPADKTESFLTLRVTDKAEPAKEIQVKVEGKTPALQSPAIATLKMEIVESLKSKAARKEEFVKNTQKRLDDIKKMLDDAQMLAKDVKPDDRSDLLKQIGKRVEDLDHANKKFDELKRTPSENWERLVPEVNNWVATAEKNVQKVHIAVKSAPK